MRKNNECDSRITANNAVLMRFGKADVASLTVKEILNMSRQRLIELLQAAALPLLSGMRFSDSRVLRRLLLEARRCCRKQGY